MILALTKPKEFYAIQTTCDDQGHWYTEIELNVKDEAEAIKNSKDRIENLEKNPGVSRRRIVFIRVIEEFDNRRRARW